MKLNKTLKLVSIALIAISAFSACESHKAGDQADKNNLLILALRGSTTSNSNANSEARKFCANAVLRMNQCIGAGSGFNPAIMCSDDNINKAATAATTATPADTSTTPVTPATDAAPAYSAAENYNKLIICVDTQVAATNCNFSQNKVASPVQAKAAFFGTCEVDYTLATTTLDQKRNKAPSGIIITFY